MAATKTFSARPAQVKRQWHLLDAAEAPLGRVATVAAKLLMGKHKPEFTHHIDVGDSVIIVNAAKLRLTGRKLQLKLYQRHSGYPGNLKTLTAQQLKDRDPTKIIEHAVRGMLSKNKLAAERMRRLRIYVDEKHGLEAQQPQPMKVSNG